MNRFLFFICLFFLLSFEILNVYFIMPMPGSQEMNSIDIAYFLYTWRWFFRIIFSSLMIYGLLTSGWKHRWIPIVSICILVSGIYVLNFQMAADHMFYQPKKLLMVSATVNKVDTQRLVIGVVSNGIAKAYPIQYLGFHHQVADSLDGKPIIVTYCTVCRTGRAFSPYFNGKLESFRLVGMDHFNAMFEDATTKSWWQQATGIAIAGPLKGTALSELSSKQLTLDVWLRQYPNSLIMQPDTSFNKDYKDLADYDKGTIKSSLEKRDSLSWKPKSWIVGVIYNHSSKAYDWNELVNKKMIQDSIAGLPIVLALEKDTASFHVYDRRVAGSVLHFQSVSNNDLLVDQNTNSTWNIDGLCIAGTLKGERLVPVQAYNEFWHSWQTFHRNAEKYVE